MPDSEKAEVTDNIGKCTMQYKGLVLKAHGAKLSYVLDLPERQELRPIPKKVLIAWVGQWRPPPSQWYRFYCAQGKLQESLEPVRDAFLGFVRRVQDLSDQMGAAIGVDIDLPKPTHWAGSPYAHDEGFCREPDCRFCCSIRDERRRLARTDKIPTTLYQRPVLGVRPRDALRALVARRM